MKLGNGLRRAVFLDRDGVINALVYRPEEGIFDSPYLLEEFRLLPEAVEAIRLIKAMGFLAVVVSNQPGIAKGKCDAAMLDRLTRLMCEELEAQAARLDGIYYCLHHPDGLVSSLRQACDCRKPKPGLLLETAREHSIDLSSSYMVGDNLKDIEAGIAAGCTSVLIQRRFEPGPQPLGSCGPHWTASSLLDAVMQIRAKELNSGNLHRLGRPG